MKRTFYRSIGAGIALVLTIAIGSSAALTGTAFAATTKHTTAPRLPTTSQIIDQGAAATVRINAYEVIHGRRYKVSAGSGFFISQSGYIMTNHHVVDDPRATYTVNLDADTEINADVVYTDPDTDLAIVKVRPGNYATLTWADSDLMSVGERVIGIGNALAKQIDSISRGKVAALDQTILARDDGDKATELLKGVVQTTANVYPGDSGGPVMDAKTGQVIAVTTAIAANRKQTSYALPINVAKQVLVRSGITL